MSAPSFGLSSESFAVLKPAKSCGYVAIAFDVFGLETYSWLFEKHPTVYVQSWGQFPLVIFYRSDAPLVSFADKTKGIWVCADGKSFQLARWTVKNFEIDLSSASELNDELMTLLVDLSRQSTATGFGS